MKQIDIYTDGGCHGNPGPGAWAFVIAGPEPAEAAGSDPETTNNRMELRAVIEALRRVSDIGPANQSVRIHTDSQYVRNGITTWIRAWLRNGWKTAAKKPVKNQDLWIALHDLDLQMQPEWLWVRGHSGNELNERCDQLVQLEIAEIESHG